MRPFMIHLLCFAKESKLFLNPISGHSFITVWKKKINGLLFFLFLFHTVLLFFTPVKCGGKTIGRISCLGLTLSVSADDLPWSDL